MLECWTHGLIIELDPGAVIEFCLRIDLGNLRLLGLAAYAKETVVMPAVQRAAMAQDSM